MKMRGNLSKPSYIFLEHKKGKDFLKSMVDNKWCTIGSLRVSECEINCQTSSSFLFKTIFEQQNENLLINKKETSENKSKYVWALQFY